MATMEAPGALTGWDALVNSFGGKVESSQVPVLPWDEWLPAYFAAATSKPLATRQVNLWRWIDALEPGVRPHARVESWPRGGGKSTSTELGVAYVGHRLTRRFALYVSETQEQANKHVQAIGNRFEKLGIGRAVNKYGNSLGWKVDLLRTDHGFNVLALGLDAAGRGVKLDDYRPDFIIFDDVDGRHDSEKTIAKKIEAITETIIPAGSSDCAVLFVQNRIHSASIMASLIDGTADFLLRREVFEEPAVIGLEYESVVTEEGREYRITAGTPTWEGQPLEVCEAQMNDWGRAAFLREAQHETDAEEDGLWQRSRDIDPFRVRPGDHPTLYRIGVAIDPNAGEGGDAAGIMVGGVYRQGSTLHGVLLEDCTVDGGPRAWAQAAVDAYKRHGGDVMVAEKNNGGDMVAITIGTVPGAPPVKLVHASRGKLTRAEPVQKLAEDGRIHHAGVFVDLERELCTWRPGDPSPNRLDAYVWLWTELMLTTVPRLPRRASTVQSM